MSDANEITRKLEGLGLCTGGTHHHRATHVCILHVKSRNRYANATGRESNRSPPGQSERRATQACPQIRQPNSRWTVSGCKWLYTNACSEVFSDPKAHSFLLTHSHSDSWPQANTLTNAYTGANPHAQADAYTETNAHAQANAYTKANPHTQAITNAEANPHTQVHACTYSGSWPGALITATRLNTSGRRYLYTGSWLETSTIF
jgi:hypothetical protein